MIEFRVKKRLNFAGAGTELNVQFKIPRGQLVTLYGKSGAGKTSVLRILSGLLRAEEGRITVSGEAWFDSKSGIDLSPQKRRVGIVFQDYALFPNMTVRENLAFALRKGQDPQVVEELISITELGNLQHRKPQSLSGGQQQRVALARALVQKPEILLLDEPLSALDRDMRATLQQYILRAHRTYELTTILVSHDVTEIAKMSDRVMVLEEGQVVRLGSPADIFPDTVPRSIRLNARLVSIKRTGEHSYFQVEIGPNRVMLPVTETEVQRHQIGDQLQIDIAAYQLAIRSADG